MEWGRHTCRAEHNHSSHMFGIFCYKKCTENATLELVSPNLAAIISPRAERAGEKEGARLLMAKPEARVSYRPPTRFTCSVQFQRSGNDVDHSLCNATLFLPGSAYFIDEGCWSGFKASFGLRHASGRARESGASARISKTWL